MLGDKGFDIVQLRFFSHPLTEFLVGIAVDMNRFHRPGAARTHQKNYKQKMRFDHHPILLHEGRIKPESEEPWSECRLNEDGAEETRPIHCEEAGGTISLGGKLVSR